MPTEHTKSTKDVNVGRTGSPFCFTLRRDWTLDVRSATQKADKCSLASGELNVYLFLLPRALSLVPLHSKSNVRLFPFPCARRPRTAYCLLLSVLCPLSSVLCASALAFEVGRWAFDVGRSSLAFAMCLMPCASLLYLPPILNSESRRGGKLRSLERTS